MPEAKAKLIDGETFSISQPYEEGHACTAAEAKALNQTRSENIGNNMRETVKAAKAKRDAGNPTDFNDLVNAIAKYDTEYTFAMGGGGTSSRKLDPIEREAKAIANDILRAHLDKTGRKLNKAPDGMSDDEWAAKVDAQREQIMVREDVVKLAKKRVADRAKVTDNESAPSIDI